jgi:hypothetical protein
MATNFSFPSSSPLVPGKLVLVGNSLSRLGESVLSIRLTAAADLGLILVKSALTGELRVVRVDSELRTTAANTLGATLAGGPLAAVVVELLGGLALHGLAEAGVDFGGGWAAEGVWGGHALGRGLLGVAGVGRVGRSGASRKDLGVELWDGIVADEDTRLVLWML